MQNVAKDTPILDREQFVKEVLTDYRIAVESRQASYLGRKEVLTGKAKFGIFGDGKEIAQLAMARVFELGDWRSGYYRDQTFMFAKGMSSVKEFFAQLYANPDVEKEPSSAGRLMNGHFSTRILDEEGNWLSQTDKFNSSSDISPTGGQMARALGLALASKLYRENTDLHQYNNFSNKGNEVSFVTIGNASSSEGIFWETVNAAAVMQVPLLINLWDDGYGISVPARFQTAKENMSELLKGFKPTPGVPGMEIFTVKGWDYPALCQAYKQAAEFCRENHAPAMVHVVEMTQPQGHSTSGSHERYKSKDRLEWEQEFDGIAKMREWIVSNEIANESQLEEIEKEATNYVKAAQKEAWADFITPIKNEITDFCEVLSNLAAQGLQTAELTEISTALQSNTEPIRRDLGVALNKALRITLGSEAKLRKPLLEFKTKFYQQNFDRFSDNLYSQSAQNALSVPVIPAETGEEMADGYQVVRACFDAALERDPRVFAFGEDVGHIGDVNQGFSGLQEKYGDLRVSDKGIREWSIIGEGVGAALRGLRPIAEIQYLDYLLYALEIMSDDIATLQYRTKGGQKCPIIIRTRGHRLEGVWHSGSPMGMIVHAVRGMHVCVPRNMVQAAGMYNTLLLSDEPALVVECLNGYRIKEKMPKNIGEFTVPLGIPEVIREGADLTMVTYGSCCRVALEAAQLLSEFDIEVQIVDVQTLLPFDINHSIVELVKQTNRLVVLDEDVPGGASAYILQELLENQNVYQYLDSKPMTIAAKAHRPAYSSDGDYFSKPSADEIFTRVYEMMHESNPDKWPM